MPSSGKEMKVAADKAAHQTRMLCFVVGPIGSVGSDIRKHADMILHAILKEVLDGKDGFYSVKRADEDVRPGMITDRVIHDILSADLVVADITDLNPNAFYELGIRHLIGRPTIHIAKVGTKLPFDNLGHDTIFVDVGDWQSILNARKRLGDAAAATREDGFVVSNPITQAKGAIALRESSDPRDKVIADLKTEIGDIRSMLKNRSRASDEGLIRNVLDVPDIGESVENLIARELSYEIQVKGLKHSDYEKFLSERCRFYGARLQMLGAHLNGQDFIINDLKIRMAYDGGSWGGSSITATHQSSD